MEGKTKPEVRSYLDSRLFLRDYYEYRKQQDSAFSFEVWAQRLGIKSKSFLRFLMVGERNITEDLTQKFCSYFQFADIDCDYFAILVLYTQCENPEQKKLYGKRLISSLRKETEMQPIPITENILADPATLVLRSLLSFEDVPKTLEVLAQLMERPLEVVEALLAGLEKEGLAVRENSQWRATQRNIRIAAKPGDESLTRYHNLSLMKALEAQSKDPQERSYRSVNLALNRAEYEAYLADLNEFVRGLFAKYNEDRLQDRRVYQMNFNLIPWTAVLKS